MCAKENIMTLAVFLMTVFNFRAASVKIPDRECLQVSEIGEFHLQGEAVVLRFRTVEMKLAKWGLSDAREFSYCFTGANVTNLNTHLSDRVRTQGLHIWFLPALTTDTGNYTCVFRGASHCIAGTISLQVYENKGPHLDMISYFQEASPGDTGFIPCPNLNEFNNTENLQWYKGSTPLALSAGHARYHRFPVEVILVIEDVSVQDDGFYTCELWVHINHRYYKVTRTTKLTVSVPILPPKILYPSNSDIFESTIGSSVKVPCRVFTGNSSASYPEVKWLVNGVEIERSVLHGRVFLDDRVTGGIEGSYAELTLILVELHEEDTRAEIKCVAQNPGGRQEVTPQIKLHGSMSSWLVVGAVGATSFLTVVCVFLYHIIKARRKLYTRKNAYMAARQNSVF